MEALGLRWTFGGARLLGLTELISERTVDLYNHTSDWPMATSPLSATKPRLKAAPAVANKEQSMEQES